MRNIKITVEYDGTNYHGWQSQANAVAIQDVIEGALRKLTGEECNLIGCSRTDVGVHALGHVSNFMTESRIPGDRFAYAINSNLPDDIVVKHSEEVPLEFHARFGAKGKKYRYVFYNNMYRTALVRNRAYHVRPPMDIEAMREAAASIVGQHDFSAFRASGSDTKTSVRTVTGLTLEKSGDVFTMEITGDGFLYNMVRIIAGTLVEVGTGRIKAGEVAGIIEGKDRRKAGRTAPACGLYLVEVYY